MNFYSASFEISRLARGRDKDLKKGNKMQKECLVFKQNQDPRIATCDTCGVSLDNHSFRKIYPTSLKYNPADVSKSASDQETVAAGAEVRAGEFEIICKSCKKLIRKEMK